jgi:hypothetical protein
MKRNRLKIETVKALIIVKTYFKNLSCAEFYDQIQNEKEILESYALEGTVPCLTPDHVSFHIHIFNI